MFLNILIVFFAFIAFLYFNNNKTIDNPKNYILNKYNSYILENYDKILSLTLSNQDLKNDILKNIQSLTYISSYYEFDIYIRNMSFLYFQNEIHQYLKYPNITQKRIQYIGIDNNSDYSIFINQKNDRIDYYSQYFRNSYLTNIDIYTLNNFNKLINKYFLYDILIMNSYFFEQLSKQIEYNKFFSQKNIYNINYDSLIIDTFHFSNFSELFYPENNDIYYTITNYLSKINLKYKCYLLIDQKCSLLSLTTTSKNIVIFNENQYLGK